MDIQEGLSALAGEVEGMVKERFPEFSPYQCNVDLSHLHDSEALKLVCSLRMVVGREPEMWLRDYYVRVFGEGERDLIMWDLMHRLKRDLSAYKMVLARQAISDGKGEGG